MDEEMGGNNTELHQQVDSTWFQYEENVHMLGENAPFGICLTDSKASCRYVNAKWCEMTGMEREEALGLGWINALHPDDRERVKTHLYRVSIDGWGRLQEFRFQSSTGKVTWVSGYVTKFRNEQNAFIGYLILNVDISARKSVEAALRASEERYRTTIDSLSDGIHVVDSDLNITLNNSTIARWVQEMGLSGILVGKNPLKAFPFLPEHVADEYRQVFQTGEILITEEVSRFAHKERYTETRKIPIFENGEVSHVATVIRDISERALAEKAFKESQNNLQAILDATTDSVLLIETDGQIVACNEALAVRFEKTKNEIVGTNIYHLLDDNVKKIRQSHGEKVISTGRPVRFLDEREDRIFDNSVYPVFDETGQVVRLAIYGQDITKRVKAEKEIRETKSLLEKTFASMDQAVFVIKPKNRTVQACNQAAENIFGYCRDEMIGQTTEFMYKDRAVYEGYVPKILPALETSGVYQTRMQLRRKDGSLFIADITDTEILNEQGKRTNVVSVIRDITERVQAEEELRNSERNLQTIFDTMSEGLALNEIIYDDGEMVDYRILKVNPAFYNVADYHGEKVVGNVATRLYGMPTEFIKEFWKEHLKVNETTHTEMWSPLSNRCFYISTSPFADDKFVTSFIDITDIKLAEEKIQKSEEHYRLLAENSTDVIALYDGEYKPLYISPSSVKMSGYGREDFQNSSIFNFVHPDDIDKLLKKIKLDTQQKVQTSLNEFRYRKKDGEYIWVETITNRSFDEDGNANQILVNIRDVTERKQAALGKEQLLEAVTRQREELRMLNARVADANEIEQRRIAKNLHDQIGQTMSALSINLNIVLSQLSDQSSEIKKRIVDSLQMVDETTDEIRNVMADLHPTVLDDYGLLPALKWLAERFEKRTDLQIAVRSRSLKEERLASSVEMSLFRITQEALNNVSRHAGAKKVKIELKQLKSFLRLSIDDDGIGFELPVQRESTDSGWGLRIMRERAESIGGRFRVESEAGKGTKVIVELGVKK